MSNDGPIQPSSSISSQAAQRQRPVMPKTQRSVMQVPPGKQAAEMADSVMAVPIRNFSTLKEQKTGKKETTETSRKEEIKEAIKEVEKSEETAERFQRQNDELQAKSLLLLKASILTEDSIEEIIRKILEFYPDKTLADEAFDFLIATAAEESLEKFKEAKKFFNEKFKREIVSGKNISHEARSFSQKGLGSPTALRDLYRDVTGNPRVPEALFQELATKYPYATLKTVIHFLLHSLGADIKSKGPSITRAELQQLLVDIRTIQAILGIYQFFKSRMNIIRQQLALHNLTLPELITFEVIAKQFISVLKERYISSNRILKLAKNMHLSHEILAQIIIFTQMRDAVRHIAPRLFKTKQHKEDLHEAILEAIEELEDELEEEEEDED